MYALVDCNNFFVSCERTLDPKLENKPVVVLSNNDGCVVSRSKEAKDLGIPMAAPAFKYRELFKEHDVQCFSAKFELYNFKSQRVIEISTAYVDKSDYEVYSIDELFLDLKSFKYIDIYEYCLKIKNEIDEQEKIPVSIGVAPTKTLCKVANRIVKQFPEKFNGIYILDTPEKIEKALKWLKIDDVWGIGRRLAVKMHDNGVHKAWDLLQKPEMWVRKIMGIHGDKNGERTERNPSVRTGCSVSQKIHCRHQKFHGNAYQKRRCSRTCGSLRNVLFRTPEKTEYLLQNGNGFCTDQPIQEGSSRISECRNPNSSQSYQFINFNWQSCK